MAGRLFVNGRVFTGRGEQDFATAFRIDGERFSWVGGRRDQLGNPLELPVDVRDAEIVDLGGATVVPGLIDAHHHPVMTATLADGACLMPPLVASIEDIVDLLTEHSIEDADTAENDREDGPENAWILGWGYDEMYLAEGRQLTRHDLDRVSTSRPVFVRRSDLHTASCNTVALRLAGIDASTPDPEGARFEREEDGSPNGVLTEFAAVEAVASQVPALSRQRLVREVREVGRHLARFGVVAVGDLAASPVDDSLKLLREAEKAGFRQRVNVYLSWSRLAERFEEEPRLREQRIPDSEREGRVRVAGAKIFCDGAISNATAWMSQPYRGTSDSFGTQTATADELREAAAWCRAQGLQLAAHAMGDAAISFIVDVLGDQDPWLDNVPSVRIEHASVLPEELLRRVTAAHVRFGVVTHAIFDYAEAEVYTANLLTRQLLDAYPLRRLFEATPYAALSSDSPATTWMDADNVFTSVQAAVDRRANNGQTLGFDQALTVAQALLMYTARPVTVTPYDGVGAIAQGRFADFVVLDRNPFDTPATELGQVQVVSTWINGERVFEAGSPEA